MKPLCNIFVATFLITSTVMAQDYDIAVVNGRVMDPEMQFVAVRNVGIKDGRIVTITEQSIE